VRELLFCYKEESIVAVDILILDVMAEEPTNLDVVVAPNFGKIVLPNEQILRDSSTAPHAIGCHIRLCPRPGLDNLHQDAGRRWETGTRSVC